MPIPSVPPHRPTPQARTPQASAKEAAIERWVVRRLGEMRHERQVAEIATQLFDITRPLHDLTAADVRLLRLASLVHDIGRCVSREKHAHEGAAMVQAETALPLSGTERRHLAYLTRFHRGAVPEAGDDPILAKSDDHNRLMRLLALLRAADALDSRSLESPRLVLALAGPGKANDSPFRLRIHCYLQTDIPEARRVYRRRKKFRLMEEMLKCRIEIEISHAHALRMVA